MWWVCPSSRAWLLLTTGGFVEAFEVAVDEGFFLLSGPLLELSFAVDSLKFRFEGLDADDMDRPTVSGEKGSTAGVVVGDALLDVLGVPDVEGAFLAAEDVD